MNWFRWHFDQHKGLIFGLLLLAAVLVAAVMFPATQNINAGFGREWECTAQGQGGPTCIKKIKP
jgi:hypothetical protein